MDAEYGMQVIYSNEDLVKMTVECLHMAKERLDLCGDHTMARLIVEMPPAIEAYLDLARRGGKIRIVTEITKENISYCKEFMKIAEVRHLDGIVVGGWGVSELDYMAAIPPNPDKEHVQPPQGLHSRVKEVLKLQKYIFDSLWEKAIPALQRIKEIEEGTKRDFLETIRDPKEISDVESRLLKSAVDEILIIFPTFNSFYLKLVAMKRKERNRTTIELIKEAASRRVNVRILVPINFVHPDPRMVSESESIIQELRDFKVQVQDTANHLQTCLMTLLVDHATSLTVDWKDDTKEDYDESIGLATYTNSEPRVATIATIFETLWIKSEDTDAQQK